MTDIKSGQNSQRVIDRVELPTRMPIAATGISFLLLDRLDPIVWIWGFYWALVIVAWLMWIVRYYQEEEESYFDMQDKIFEHWKKQFDKEHGIDR